MNALNLIRFAAMLQREHSGLFQKFFVCYAAEHSPPIAHYMKRMLQFWANGKVDVQYESRARFLSVAFPTTSQSEINWLIRRHSDDTRAVRMLSFSESLRIESGLAQQIDNLRNIVQNFLEAPYNFYVSGEFYDGMLWVLHGDSSAFWSNLKRYILPLGESAFKSVSKPIESFIYTVEKRALPIPYKKTFDYTGGKIEIDYDHSFTTRLVERLKFWKPAPQPLATPPNSQRNLVCPNRSCRRTMTLTPEEVKANVFACPWCWEYGSTFSHKAP